MVEKLSWLAMDISCKKMNRRLTQGSRISKPISITLVSDNSDSQ